LGGDDFARVPPDRSIMAAAARGRSEAGWFSIEAVEDDPSFAWRSVFHPQDNVQDARSAPPAAVARRAILDIVLRMKKIAFMRTMAQ